MSLIKNKKTQKRLRLKKKIRSRVFGTAEMPRLSVFRSNSHMYAQIINDDTAKTLVSSSDLKLKGTNKEKAKSVGKELAEKAVGAKIKKVVFDRNGFRFTGRVKVLADQAREGGLEF